MPSGVCYDHTTCIIGNGVALDINKFCKELDDVKKAGLNPKLLVSERAQILMPYHILLDEYEEERLGKMHSAQLRAVLLRFSATSMLKSVFR